MVAKKCRFCGEIIPVALPREALEAEAKQKKNPDLAYACTDCLSEGGYLPSNPNGAVVQSEKNYHGGRFNRGEW